MKFFLFLLISLFSPMAQADCLSDAGQELVRCRNSCTMSELCRVNAKQINFAEKRRCAGRGENPAVIRVSGDAVTAPERGSFNWKQLRGYYRFGECTVVNDKPLWSGSPEDSHIEISDERDWEHGGNEDYLEAVRYNDNGNPIALMWNFEMIGKGQQLSYDNDGKAYGTFESWATADGIYGVLTWDREFNKGWSIMRLTQDAAGGVSYRLQQMHEGDEFAHDETCKLLKQ